MATNPVALSIIDGSSATSAGQTQSTSAPSASGVASAPAPFTPTPAATSTAYAEDTLFGQYLNANPNAATASGYLKSLLGTYNLSSLFDTVVKPMLVAGTTNTDIITQKLFATKEFAQEFPEIAGRAAKGYTALSPQQILDNRTAYETALKKNGIDPSFVTKEQMAQWQINNVAPTEVDSRLSNTVVRLQNDPGTAAQMQLLYQQGMTSGEVAAYFLDPDHTEQYFAKQVSAADLAARAKASGFGQIDKTQAENLAGLGVTSSQATQGFGNIAQQKALLDPLASENGAISNDTAISAQFNNNAAAQEQLKKRLQGRQADFAGGGNFVDPNKSGITGAGISNA